MNRDGITGLYEYMSSQNKGNLGKADSASVFESKSFKKSRLLLG